MSENWQIRNYRYFFKKKSSKSDPFNCRSYIFLYQFFCRNRFQRVSLPRRQNYSEFDIFPHDILKITLLICSHEFRLVRTTGERPIPETK